MANTKKETVEVTSLAQELRTYKSTDIKIVPYLNPKNQNMGLEKYNQVLFEGTTLKQGIKCLEQGGKIRYITGLDESAPEVKNIMNADEKAAKIKSIRETLAEAEYALFGNRVDPSLKNLTFYDQVTLSPFKRDYWDQVTLEVGNEGVTLNPQWTRDLLTIIAAEAGGFDQIAPSFEAAENDPKMVKFYVERRRDTRIQEARLKEQRDDAVYDLMKLRREEPQRLFWIAKNLLPVANQYKPKDPVEIWYGDLRDYIEGESIEKNKKMAPKKFMAVASRSEQYLQVRGYVLDAAYLKLLITKADQKIYNYETGSMLGGNIEEVVQFLSEPMNQNELDHLQTAVENNWN